MGLLKYNLLFWPFAKLYLPSLGFQLIRLATLFSGLRYGGKVGPQQNMTHSLKTPTHTLADIDTHLELQISRLMCT